MKDWYMNKINPSYLFLVTLVIMLFSIVQLDKTYSVLKVNQQEDIQYLKLANKYKKLKTTWSNNNTKNNIMSIVKILHIKNITIEKRNNILKIQIKNSNFLIIDKFLNKLLNNAIIINSFKITNNSLKMEVSI